MIEQIGSHPFFAHFKEALQKNDSLTFEKLWDTPKALLVHFAQQYLRCPIVVITSGKNKNRLYDDLVFFAEHVHEFPAWEALPGEDITPSPDIIGTRIETLYNLHHATHLPIVLAPMQALLQKVPERNLCSRQYSTLKVGDEIAFDGIAEHFTQLGYERVNLVNDKGQFAMRGGIVDIFPINSPHPFRIDFFGDEIEQIKVFDPMGQTSIESISQIHLPPADEMQLMEKSNSLLFDYFETSPLIIFDELLHIEDTYAAITKMPGFHSKWVISFEEMLQYIQNNKKLYWTDTPIEELSEEAQNTRVGREFFTGKNPVEPITFEIFNQTLNTHRMLHPFEPLSEHFALSISSVEMQKQGIASGMQKIADSDTQTFLVAQNSQEHNKLTAWIPTRPAHCESLDGYLSSGFAMRDKSLVVVSYTDMTQRYKVSRKKWRSTYHTPVSEFHQLTVGDLVVHYHNGIGKYLGIEKQKNHLGIESEFLIIEYADEAKLFVPSSQAHLVSKYIGSHHEKPDLHKIGAAKWNKAKQQAQKSIIGYAKDLLHMQAQRDSKGGFIYAEDTIDMIEFEEEFPYHETDDQLLAIDAIKQDMCSEKAMERLICGDVGYGKTEVAMRAAFKAVADGNKQVAVLVPTTVLALQHYENFKDRMQNFPIEIGIVSRFQTPKQAKETLLKTKEGKVDILIGTHRLTSKDIAFKDLGLIIIDEEQRFGVRAKEKLKNFKIGVDCISLSATPIPRTLYMSLINIRDMSVINSPPQDRLPIKTIICDRDEEIIKTALLRELARDGQAYFIHNRVETIFQVAEEIQKLMPQAKISVVHGQMNSDRIDQIFHDFKSGVTDILVATSIVENGIDIPNANTILIDRSHHFGVADLYQLRGRVGRWNKSAYAYFLTPKHRQLPEISQKRLQALVESSGYGGGMKLAMRDLEIRGAGDILGVKQSGQVSSVGFHLYCKMLKKAIKAIQNQKDTTFHEVKLEFTFDAKLPEYYIADTSIRLEFYHRFGEAAEYEELDQLMLELKDRFGKPPEPVLWLYHLARVRIFAMEHYISSIKYEKLSIIVEKLHKKKSNKKVFMTPPLQGPQEVELMTRKRIEDGGF